MKQITLNQLGIANFGCFTDECVIAFNEADTYITGRNGLGKSTIADAYAWLFTGNLMNGNRADSIRPHDLKGENLNSDPVVVWATCEYNGRKYTFRKEQTLEPTGRNHHHYYINGYEKGQTAYENFMDNIIDSETFLMCTSALPFFKRSTADRRGALFNAVAATWDEEDVTDDEKYTELYFLLDEAPYDEVLEQAEKDAKHLKIASKQITDTIVALSSCKLVCPCCGRGIPRDIFNERVKVLREEQAAAGVKRAKAEKTLELLKEYQGLRLEELNYKLSKFLPEGLTFKFFEPNVASSGYRDVCELESYGEKYGKRLNSGAKVYVNAALVTMFQQASDVRLPIFIDNAEQCSSDTLELMKNVVGDRQMIVISASEADHIQIEKGELTCQK